MHKQTPAHTLPAWQILVASVGSAALLLTSALHWLPIPLTESLGFVTGGVCVWLVVREHMWNWPVGLANNVFFFVLFYQSRLFADMGLQVVYFAMGVWGWLHWKFGGEARRELQISRTRTLEWVALAAAIPLCTWALRVVLIAVNGSAPFWDSLTTVLSLVAQYLLCQKRVENWLFWMLADIIYVPLYLSRGLTLTAVLYAFFFLLCCAGLGQWLRSMKKAEVSLA